MKKILYPIIAIALLVALFFVQKYQNESISQENIQAVQSKGTLSRADFIPYSNNQIIHHKTYSLSYNEQHEQAEWTVHVLTASDIKKADYKRPYFEIDDMVSTGAASWRNYKNSGFDCGHLVPAGDRRGSIEDYNETFLTSNISPQRHDFNAGVWNDLEQKVRRQVTNNKKLYIVTGSVLIEGLPSIGNEAVSIPEQFYKIIYDPGSQRMVAYLIPNQKTSEPVQKFAIAVDEIEKLTGIDFFAQLEDGIENRLESQADSF